MAGLYSHPDCNASHLVQAGLTLDLTSPVQEGGVTVFRSTLYVRLPLDQKCQALVLGPGSKLQVHFEPATVQVTRTDNEWVTKWHDDDAEHVAVQLIYPAPIVKVHSDFYSKVDLHRVDGEAVADKPTIENASTDQALPTAFVAAAFQAAFSGPIPQKKKKSQQGGNFNSLSAAAVKGEKMSGKTKLVESSLGQLDLRGQPTTPRLRLMSADQSESLWQWIQPGEQVAPVEYSALGSDLGGQLQPALDRALALRQGTETQMVLTLLVESDAPCSVVLQQANLEFQLQTALLPEPAQASFTGGSEQTQLVSLATPAGQAVRLQLQASVAQRDPKAAGEPGALADGRTGVQMEAGMQTATLWQADGSYWLIGLAIAWYGVSERAALRISLLPEAAGPAAATGSLAEASVDASATGPAWLRFQWPQVPLQPGRYWVRLQVESGSGLWLGEASEELCPLWQQTPPATATLSSVPLSLLHFALEPVAPQQAQAMPVRFKLNGIELAATSPQPDALAAEATSAAALAAASPWTLTASSAKDLSVTFQSALLTYQI